jgi:hypothetical protein
MSHRPAPAVLLVASQQPEIGYAGESDHAREDEGHRRWKPFDLGARTRERPTPEVRRAIASANATPEQTTDIHQRPFATRATAVKPVKTRYAASIPMTTDVSTPVAAAMPAPVRPMVSIA